MQSKNQVEIITFLNDLKLSLTLFLHVIENHITKALPHFQAPHLHIADKILGSSKSRARNGDPTASFSILNTAYKIIQIMKTIFLSTSILMGIFEFFT